VRVREKQGKWTDGGNIAYLRIPFATFQQHLPADVSKKLWLQFIACPKGRCCAFRDWLRFDHQLTWAQFSIE
jgi:hypothetical protein